MWGSVASLEALASFAFWVGVISGGVALVAGAALTITSNRIAELTKADADVRISEANARAEEAKLETERIKKEFSWRDVSAAQFEELRDALSGNTFGVTISWTAGDPEGSYFAQRLAQAFRASGLEIRAFSPIGLLGEEQHGLNISGWNNDEIQALNKAFIAADFGRPNIQAHSNPGEGMPGSVTHIFVGYRDVPATQ